MVLFRRGDSGPSIGVSGRELEPVAALLVRCADGDHTAFAELYDSMSPLVHGVVLRVIRNAAMAEETTQEVFLEIWRRSATFDPSAGSARSWTATIAHRRAVDRVRSEQAARVRDENDGAKHVVAHDSVADAVDLQLDHEAVSRALGALSDLQREAIELAFYGGLTYREVGIRLDVAEGTVKTRIRDGLIKLREAMEVAR